MPWLWQFTFEVIFVLDSLLVFLKTNKVISANENSRNPFAALGGKIAAAFGVPEQSYAMAA